MKKQDLVRVFVKGGILSPGDLLKILQTAQKLGTDYVHFGSRQDILFPVKEQSLAVLDQTFKSIDTAYEINEFTHQNIVSSYVSLDVMPNRIWLVPHVYHYILDSINFKPKYRINIVDPIQSIVPLFTGNINFIAAKEDNYWYLYLRFKNQENKPVKYSKLIYGYDLHKVAELICEMNIYEENLSISELFEAIDQLKISTQNPLEDLQFPESHSPYYEGLNREQSGNYWLGLYWRNNEFDINLLKDLCKKCMQTNVGKISLTPWKSFIVKGINPRDLMGWEKLMGSYGMNLRHSSLELNWHLPMLNEECLELKNYLVRVLDQQDICTTGLNFTIKPNDDLYLFTSVVIEYDESKSNDNNYLYNILYSKEFNPNSAEYNTYVSGVTKEILPSLLIELSHMYYEQLEELPVIAPKKNETTTTSNTDQFQCESCMTVYDETYGDPVANIEPSVSFSDLPGNYECPTCGNSKDKYAKIDS